MTQCPQCKIKVNEHALDCPACGILFSKWNEREQNVAAGNLSRYATIANATSSSFNWTILVILAVVFVGILFFMKHNAIGD